MAGTNYAATAPELIIVTGAGRGIGLETARLLVESGSTVIAIDVLADVLDAPSTECAGRWHGLEADITADSFPGALLAVVAKVQASQPNKSNETARSSLGLVNCAFTEQRAAILEGTKAGWQRTMDVNFYAAVDLARAVARLAMEGGYHASIVNVTSVHANLAHAEFGAYSASKAALTAFTRSASEEWGPRGIRVNAVAPGFVAVERNEPVWSNPNLASSLKACNNLARLAGPGEIAAGIIFLLSPAASFITGAVLAVDGGQTSRLLEVPRS